MIQKVSGVGSNNISFAGSVDMTKNGMKKAMTYFSSADMSSETQKEIVQFLNTIRAVYRDRTANVLSLENKHVTQLHDIPSVLADGDMFVLRYGKYESSYRSNNDSNRGAFWEIIKFGKKYFGENVINRPVENLKELNNIRQRLASFRVQQVNIQNNIDILQKSLYSFLIKE